MEGYIGGKVADCDGFFYEGCAAFLLEDIAGDVVEVIVRDVAEESVLGLFPLGREIAIVNPCLEDRVNLPGCIMVDGPQDVSGEFRFPDGALRWKELGKEFLEGDMNVKGALLCYDKGLNWERRIVATEGWTNLKQEISTILNNIALCESRVDNWESCAYFATVSLAVRKSCKAAYRLALSMHELGDANEAKAYLKQAMKQFEGSEKDDVVQLAKQWKHAKSSSRPACSSAQWCDARAVGWAIEAAASSGRAIISAAVAGTSLEWTELKKRGNARFREGDVEGARELYLRALSNCSQFAEVRQEVCSLMNDKADAYATMKNKEEEELVNALMTACQASLLNFCGNAKGWVRWARFLQEFGGSGCAVKLLDKVIETLEITSETFRFGTLFPVEGSEASNRLLHLQRTELEKYRRSSSSNTPPQAMKEVDSIGGRQEHAKMIELFAQIDKALTLGPDDDIRIELERLRAASTVCESLKRLKGPVAGQRVTGSALRSTKSSRKCLKEWTWISRKTFCIGLTLTQE
eukprot:GHVU01086128.1.p1 GENE.GHVU01086128.1~~GHVU01086128.1.p1  ORF type:complete len:522 (+),score=60.47 GHVU01086128.1:214-1779(+)